MQAITTLILESLLIWTRQGLVMQQMRTMMNGRWSNIKFLLVASQFPYAHKAFSWKALDHTLATGAVSPAATGVHVHHLRKVSRWVANISVGKLLSSVCRTLHAPTWSLMPVSAPFLSNNPHLSIPLSSHLIYPYITFSISSLVKDLDRWKPPVPVLPPSSLSTKWKNLRFPPL